MCPELLSHRREEDNEEPRGAFERLFGAGITMRLLKQRTIIMAGEVNKKLADRINSQLLVLDGEDSQAPIQLYIDSPGGDADAGFAMYDVLRFISAPVKTISAGLCASAAVLVLLGTQRGNRFSLPNSRILIHQPSTVVRGDVSDIQIEASEIIKCRDKINEIIAQATGQDAKKVEKDTKRNYWMSAEEALEYGLVGKVISSRGELG